MSKYTTEVRFICEQYAGLSESIGFQDVETVIQKAIPHIFNFNFPIFDEKYRNVLETKILRHFYTREIGLETVGLWKLKLSTKLNEIMPYYNQLYKSELLEFNPLYDVDLTRTHTTTKDGTTNTRTTSDTETNTEVMTEENVTADYSRKDNETNNNTETRKRMYSDTPQGAISDLESGRYLTDATIENNVYQNVRDITQTDSTTSESNGGSTTESSVSNTGSSNTSIKDTETYLEVVKGKQGSTSFTKLLMEYRDTFLNIDMLVINELNELFMGLW